jgi:hypothetical protein
MSVSIKDYCYGACIVFVGGLIGRAIHNKTYKLPAYEIISTAGFATAWPFTVGFTLGVEVWQFVTGDEISYKFSLTRTRTSVVHEKE